MAADWIQMGAPVHEAERAGLKWLADSLPAGCAVFSNLMLPSGRRGQFYEYDAVVLTPEAVFCVELKSWGGAIRGNRDRWVLADQAVVTSPAPLIQHKAKVLKGLLERRSVELGRVWVQGLVFLSAADAAPQITEGWADIVHTRAGIAAAVQSGWGGRGGAGQRGAISAALRDMIESVLVDSGHGVPKPDRVGDFRLLQRLDAEEWPCDIWLAESGLMGQRKLLHVYGLEAEDGEGRERLKRRVLREATLHERLRGGPDMLSYEGYFRADGPDRIALVFEDTTPFLPLPTWLRERRPGLAARLRAGARVARALAWVHARGLIHRRLSGEAVLVGAGEPPELRLCALELAHDVSGRAPTVTTEAGRALRFSAPEAVRSGEATVQSDRFALGAVLVELLTGQPLFPSVESLMRPIRLPALVVGEQPVPAQIRQILLALLSRAPADRPAPEVVADLLEQEGPQREARAEPRPALAPGALVRGNFRLVEPAGHGATATAWQAIHQQTGDMRVLKIADGTRAASLRVEARVLEAVRHPALVRFYDLQADGDSRMVLVLEHVPGHTLSGAAPLLPVAEGLFGALGALHAQGWLHRDVKPDNAVLRPEGRPVLLDLGLAGRDGDQDLAVGTPRYKDPLVYTEERWSPANDLYAAALVLRECATGSHLLSGRSPDPDGLPALIAADLSDQPHPAALAAWFRAALSPRRADRPADAAAAFAGFAAACEGRAGSVLPAGASADASAGAIVPEAVSPEAVSSGAPPEIVPVAVQREVLPSGERADLSARLDALVPGWPPIPREAVAARLWAESGSARRIGLEADALLALLLADSPLWTGPDGLYRPPVPAAEVLRRFRGMLPERGASAELLRAAGGLITGIVPETDPSGALRAAGWRREGADRWCDPDRVPEVQAPEEIRNDQDIRRERADGAAPEVVRMLHASAGFSGMRVVAMPPARHHLLSRQLHGWLCESVGPEQVGWIDVDQVILQALRASPLWEFLPWQERSGSTDWGWLHAEATAGLDAAVRATARPGRVTLLARPALLGTLGLLSSWLTGLYERARRGGHGLIVLAVPGGVRDQRVQLNGRYPFPCTPDMAPVYLE